MCDGFLGDADEDVFGLACCWGFDGGGSADLVLDRVWAMGDDAFRVEGADTFPPTLRGGFKPCVEVDTDIDEVATLAETLVSTF